MESSRESAAAFRGTNSRKTGDGTARFAAERSHARGMKRVIADETATKKGAESAPPEQNAETNGTTPKTACQKTSPPPEQLGRKRNYRKDLPKKLYLFFLRTAEAGELPSLDKFAVANGMTLDEVRSFFSHGEFERAARECNEIRRDYLIDQAMCKRADASFVKFLLSSEYGMGDKAPEEDRDLAVTLTVVQ